MKDRRAKVLKGRKINFLKRLHSEIANQTDSHSNASSDDEDEYVVAMNRKEKMDDEKKRRIKLRNEQKDIKKRDPTSTASHHPCALCCHRFIYPDNLPGICIYKRVGGL